MTLIKLVLIVAAVILVLIISAKMRRSFFRAANMEDLDLQDGELANPKQTNHTRYGFFQVKVWDGGATLQEHSATALRLTHVLKTRWDDRATVEERAQLLLQHPDASPTEVWLAFDWLDRAAQATDAPEQQKKYMLSPKDKAALLALVRKRADELEEARQRLAAEAGALPPQDPPTRPTWKGQGEVDPELLQGGTVDLENVGETPPNQQVVSISRLTGGRKAVRKG